MTLRTPAAAIVGAGPRGLSVVERLCAAVVHGGRSRTLTVHVVDPYPPGPGAVWRTDQSGHLLMNTVSAQVTVFTDDSVRCAGPIVPGPTLYEWAQAVTAKSHLNPARLPRRALDEAAALGPDAYSTRALYGHYLRWAFAEVAAAAAPTVTVVHHARRAVHLATTGGDGAALTLDDGSALGGLDAVVLALGHTGERVDVEQQRHLDFATRHGGHYLSPANPADVDLDGIGAGEPVVVRGMGLAYFDYQALLTLGRGGRFERVEDSGILEYRPSGREPLLVVGSRRGIPYHSRGANQKPPQERHRPEVLTSARIELIKERARLLGDVTFKRDIWPLVSLEVELVYYRKALAGVLEPSRLEQFLRRYGATDDEMQRYRLLNLFAVPRAAWWAWRMLDRPHRGENFADRAAFRVWLLAYLRDDVAAAREGNIDGPLKAALDVLRDLRNEVRLLVDHGGITGRSYSEDLQDWYTPFNAFLSIGPPMGRVEELAALIEAGVVEMVGPGIVVERDETDGVFRAWSSTVPGPEIATRSLIEARLPEAHLSRTTDPLMSRMLEEGVCRRFSIYDPVEGVPIEFGGLAVTESPFRLIAADGTAHRRVFALGVPTESVHWASAAGIRPGVNSVTLTDTDAVATAVVELLDAARSPWPGPAAAQRATA